MEGHKRSMTWTVAPVRKALIGVGKLVESGNDVIFGKFPRIINIKTGQTTKMRRVNGIYHVDLWINVGKQGAQEGKNASPVFAGQR